MPPCAHCQFLIRERYLRTGLIRWHPCVDCDVALSSGSERHSEDGSDPVSSDIERFDEGIIPPVMTDDEEYDEDGCDIEQLDEGVVPPVMANDEEPGTDCDVGALLAGAMPEPMGLVGGPNLGELPMPSGAESMGALPMPSGAAESMGALPMPSGAESVGALPSGSSTTLTGAMTKGTADPGLTEAAGTGVLAGALSLHRSDAAMPSSRLAVPSCPPHADASELTDAHMCLDCESCSLGSCLLWCRCFCVPYHFRRPIKHNYLCSNHGARASDPLLDLLDECTFD